MQPIKAPDIDKATAGLEHLSLKEKKYSKYRKMSPESLTWFNAFSSGEKHSDFYYFCKFRITDLALKVIQEASSDPSILLMTKKYKRSAFDIVCENRDEKIFIPFVECLAASKRTEVKTELRRHIRKACENKRYEEVGLFLKAHNKSAQYLFHGFRKSCSPFHEIIKHGGDGKDQMKYEVILEYLRLLNVDRTECGESLNLIFSAVEANNLEAIRAFAKLYGAEDKGYLWVTQEPKYSPIHRAYSLGHRDLIKIYISECEDVVRFFSISLFHLFCSGDTLEDASLVEALLLKMPDKIDSRSTWWNNDTMTGLQVACATGKNNIIKLFVENKEKWPSIIRDCGGIDKTPFQILCENNNVYGFRLYVSAFKDKLEWFFSEEIENIVRLLKLAYNSNARDIVTEIFMECGKDVNLLALKHFDQTTMLHLAAQYGDAVALSYYSSLEARNLYFETDENCNTPLHIACANGKVDFIKAYVSLCQNQKDALWSKNKAGMTPLSCALSRQMDVAALEEVAILFLQNCVDYDKKLLEADSLGYILFRQGARQGCLAIIKAYTTYFSKDPTQLIGSCPLHYMKGNRDARCFQEFVRIFSPEISPLFIKDPTGNTLLHLAAILGNRAIVEAYLALCKGREESLFVKNADGRSPFDILIRQKNSDMVVNYMIHTKKLLFSDSSLQEKLFKDLIYCQMFEAALWIFENVETTLALHEEMEKELFFALGRSLSYEIIKPWIDTDPKKFLSMKNRDGKTLLFTGNAALISYCITTHGEKYTDLFFSADGYLNETPCIDALKCGQAEIVTSYLENVATRARLMKDNYKGETVFQFIFSYGLFSILDIFIEKSGASLDSLVTEINGKDYARHMVACREKAKAYFPGLAKYPELLFIVDGSGATPIQLAYTHNYSEIVDIYFQLLEKHPQFWVNECIGDDTLFDKAVRRLDIVMLQRIVEALKVNKELLYEKQIITRGLQRAAKFERFELGQFLLKIEPRKSHSICTPDSRGESFIHIAARRGSVDLLECYGTFHNGEELRKKNNLGETPLKIAVTELVSIMNTDSKKKEQFLRTISFLFNTLPIGLHPFLMDISSTTILHEACKIGDVPIVEKFLSEAIESDIHAQVLFKEHPLTTAVQCNQGDIINLYMAKDIRYAQAINSGGTSTPFHTAIIRGKIKIIEQFFSYLDKDPTLFFAQGKDGKTALHYACQKGDSDTLKKCIKIAGDSVEFLAIQDNEGNTPLHLIPYSDCGFDLIESLRLRQDLLFRQNMKGETCLHLFAARDLKKAAMVVLQFADPKYLELKNRAGQIASEIAVIKPQKKSDENCTIS